MLLNQSLTKVAPRVPLGSKILAAEACVFQGNIPTELRPCPC